MASKDGRDGGITFRALQLINEHRNAYGLRYNDYARYKNHCKNRTHRLRASLKMTHGKGKEFKKLPSVTLDNTKSGHLQLLLFETERAWAHSQELYSASLSQASKDDQSTNNASKLRHSATNRFRRSLHWSAQLFSLAQALFSSSRLSANSMLELTAYTCLLSGRFLRSRGSYQESLNMLSASFVILDRLGKAATTSRDQALATFFADSIAPEIRYCAHQMGIKDAHDVARIAKEAGPKAAGEVVKDFEGLVKKAAEEGGNAEEGGRSRKLREMEWEGKKVEVRIPELVDVLLVVQDAEDKMRAGEKAKEGKNAIDGTGKRQRKGVAAFDAVLAALSDAEDIARKLVEVQKTTTGSTSSKPGDQDVHFLHAYIVYQLLSFRIERDLTLINALIESSKSGQKSARSATKSGSEKSKDTDVWDETLDARVNPAVVKLLDTVLQSLSHMRSLSVVDESPDVANGIELRMAHTRSQRCLFLSRSYAAVKQYAKTILLIRRATTYIRESHPFLPSSSAPSPSSSHLTFYPLTHSSFTSLSSQLAADETKYNHEWFAYNGGQVSEARDTSKKPLFFDIALNYVQLDMESLYKRAGMDVPDSAKAPPPSAASIAGVGMEGAKAGSGKTREDLVPRPETPEPGSGAAAGATKGGLSSLLGGWWGRK